ncbi:hypothetical protein PRV_01440 [Mycoplasma parvum str. Indiana]|uniref:GMP synthase (glutamine-hydrolyzing) n=1 Tax=Mycoplasma parvum str. Indiana TaxID=1403316 RepID=U5NC97_9MOLU|nr:hypothetical protein PRV_01440 [Mycoplasma parvum str. Indiana]
MNNKEIPIMGICFGMQLIHYFFGGKIEKTISLFGEGEVIREREHLLFSEIPKKFKIWGSFFESVTKLGNGFYSLASSKEKVCLISAHVSRPIYTIQFHPELNETEFGTQLFMNFLTKVAKINFQAKQETDYRLKKNSIQVDELIEKYKEELEDAKVLVALSGGLDSSVLIHLIGEMVLEKNIYPVYLSTGLIPKKMEERTVNYFSLKFSNFKVISWKESIFKELKGITNPEEKRKLIAQKFKTTFDEIFKEEKSKGITHLAQGTIYSDVIESGKLSSKYSKIKTHHNVEMINTKNLPYKVIEPLSTLFKDQVRELGNACDLPAFLLSQQPFPGPGLAIRVIGEVTEEKVNLLSSIHDFIEQEFIERKLGKYSDQYFPILLSEEAVGVKGDQRVYGYAIVLRAIKTIDFMSANVSEIPLNALVAIANKIVSKFSEVTRVLFDLTTKPGGTIEWE